MKKFYELLRKLLMEIDDIYDENEKLILEDYLRIEILEFIKEAGLNLDCIDKFLEVELKRLGLLDLRPTLKKELSKNILGEIYIEQNDDTRRNSLYEETRGVINEDKAIED